MTRIFIMTSLMQCGKVVLIFDACFHQLFRNWSHSKLLAPIGPIAYAFLDFGCDIVSAYVPLSPERWKFTAVGSAGNACALLAQALSSSLISEMFFFFAN
jgi:hypothetical protein